MKKFLAFALIFALVLSCGVTAFAAVSSEVAPSHDDAATAPMPGGTGDWVLEVYNKEDVLIDVVPKEKVVRLQVGSANALSPEDKETFLKCYEDVKDVEDRIVKYFFWLNTKDYVEPEDFAYYKWPFSTSGENVSVTVNGKDMEVVSEGGIKYFAKLTELGAVAILTD